MSWSFDVAGQDENEVLSLFERRHRQFAEPQGAPESLIEAACQLVHRAPADRPLTLRSAGHMQKDGQSWCTVTLQYGPEPKAAA
jgi:hypothetical protein